MRFLDRFLPKQQGKRELVYVALLVIPIMVAGFVFAELGWLYKDVPTSTPTAIIATPEATPVSTPIAE